MEQIHTCREYAILWRIRPFLSFYYSDLTQTNGILLRFYSDICTKKWRVEPLGSRLQPTPNFSVQILDFGVFWVLQKFWAFCILYNVFRSTVAPLKKCNLTLFLSVKWNTLYILRRVAVSNRWVTQLNQLNINNWPDLAQPHEGFLRAACLVALPHAWLGVQHCFMVGWKPLPAPFPVESGWK